MFSGRIIDGPHKGQWIQHYAPVVRLVVPDPLPEVLDLNAPVREIVRTALYYFDTRTETWKELRK